MVFLFCVLFELLLRLLHVKRKISTQAKELALRYNDSCLEMPPPDTQKRPELRFLKRLASGQNRIPRAVSSKPMKSPMLGFQGSKAAYLKSRA